METLETLPEGSPTRAPEMDSLEGTMLGPGARYRILQRLGEGGFGTVYMAQQNEPVRRRVAVKVLKAGMDTRQVVARFESERQALAMMDHPSIAKVFDGGETAQGRPFFVMELVRGTPITAFCDREKFDTRARLQLFLQVCGALQHAHQKGIIHRDVKPANVLVTKPDGDEPVPKVIDFGVAKAIDAPLTEKTLFTRFEQMIGTPAYMSPEQAGAEGCLDIDTRSDIYALGVLLYELLSGATPFEAETLQQAAYDEVRRTLREDEAPRPSARLSSLAADRRTTIARARGTEAAALGKLLRGDLDWIVMKAIEKDRRRRYETASALALDVQRHLADEPVSAGPPTWRYRTGKYLRRHRVGVGIACLLLASLAGGLALAGMGFTEAKRNSAIARKAEAQLEEEAATLRRINATLLKELKDQHVWDWRPELVRHTLLQVGQILEAQDARRPGLDQVAELLEQHLAEADLEAAAEANVRVVLAELFLANRLPGRAHRWLMPSVKRLAVDDGIHAATEHAAARLLMEGLVEARRLTSAHQLVAQLEDACQAELEPAEFERISRVLFGRASLGAAARNGRRSDFTTAQIQYRAAYETAPHLFAAGDVLNHALCCLMSHDREAYESVSTAIMERYAESNDARELATATYTYLLVEREKDPVLLSQGLAMAEKVWELRRHPWDALSVGLAEFRRENFERARTFFAEAEKPGAPENCATIAAAFLAMEAAERGHLALAAEHLSRARANQEVNLSMVPGPRDLGIEWFDLTACRIVIGQAAEELEQALAEGEVRPSPSK